MKCPRCRSERVQFGTNTSGSNFSNGDACCGFILMGPLGLLCGFCGSDVKTEEFWVCQDCGCKFSTEGAQAADEKEKEEQHNKEMAYAKYLKDKSCKEKALKLYGSVANIDSKCKAAKDEFDRGVEEYNKIFDERIEEELSTIESVRCAYQLANKKLNIAVKILLVLCILIGIVVFFVGIDAIVGGLLLVGLAMIAAGIIPFWRTHKKKNQGINDLTKLIYCDNLDIKDLFRKVKQSETSYSNLLEMYNAIVDCDEYERNMQNEKS